MKFAPVLRIAFFFLFAKSVIATDECSFVFRPLNPSSGETLAVATTDTVAWTQTWTVSVIEGFTCPSVETVVATLFVNGGYYYLPTTDTFFLATGTTTLVDTFPLATYATLTPQLATLSYGLYYDAVFEPGAYIVITTNEGAGPAATGYTFPTSSSDASTETAPTVATNFNGGGGATPTSPAGASAGNCVYGNNDYNDSCGGNTNHQGGATSLKVNWTLWIVCFISAFFALLVIGDNCDYGSNSDNNVCANTTNIDNPPQSQSTEVEGNKIALGVGIGIGVPTLIISLVAIWLTVRHWKRKERAKKEAQPT